MNPRYGDGKAASSARSADRAALECLATVLDSREHVTALITGGDRPPRLAVISRHTRIWEDIYAAHNWFWWSWAERIAPLTEPPAAAAAITRHLRAAPEARAWVRPLALG